MRYMLSKESYIFRFDMKITKCDKSTKEFYEEYLRENWKLTFPIMKDVSYFHKIRPDDGVEFCIMI